MGVVGSQESFVMALSIRDVVSVAFLLVVLGLILNLVGTLRACFR
jgi:hypothetical protein